MAERVGAEHAVEPEAQAAASAPALAMRGGAFTSLLSLQRAAGNHAVCGVVGRMPARPAPTPARALQRCSAGGCTCGGRCGGAHDDELEEDPLVAVAGLQRAAAVRRMIARQGGPYHPPVGTPMACNVNDSCSELSTKINYLRHTIRSHQDWDIANPDPNYPGGRHAAEIADLQRALANCTAIHNQRCTGQPRWIPVPAEQPQENPEQRAERIKQQLYEALPYAVAVVVIGLVVACVLIEPCGVAVAAALAAVLGEEALALVMGILASNGVRWATQ